MDENKIAIAVRACISAAQKTERPFRSINESLGLLKRHGWTNEERLEVQNQVLKAMKQLRAASS